MAKMRKLAVGTLSALTVLGCGIVAPLAVADVPTADNPSPAIVSGLAVGDGSLITPQDKNGKDAKFSVGMQLRAADGSVSNNFPMPVDPRVDPLTRLKCMRNNLIDLTQTTQLTARIQVRNNTASPLYGLTYQVGLRDGDAEYDTTGSQSEPSGFVVDGPKLKEFITTSGVSSKITIWFILKDGTQKTLAMMTDADWDNVATVWLRGTLPASTGPDDVITVDVPLKFNQDPATFTGLTPVASLQNYKLVLAGTDYGEAMSKKAEGYKRIIRFRGFTPLTELDNGGAASQHGTTGKFVAMEKSGAANYNDLSGPFTQVPLAVQQAMPTVKHRDVDAAKKVPFADGSNLQYQTTYTNGLRSQCSGYESMISKISTAEINSYDVDLMPIRDAIRDKGYSVGATATEIMPAYTYSMSAQQPSFVDAQGAPIAMNEGTYAPFAAELSNAHVRLVKVVEASDVTIPQYSAYDARAQLSTIRGLAEQAAQAGNLDLATLTSDRNPQALTDAKQVITYSTANYDAPDGTGIPTRVIIDASQVDTGTPGTYPVTYKRAVKTQDAAGTWVEDIVSTTAQITVTAVNAAYQQASASRENLDPVTVNVAAPSFADANGAAVTPALNANGAYALNDGTTLPKGWDVAVNPNDGALTVTMAKDAATGTHELPIKVSFADGSSTVLNAQVSFTQKAATLTPGTPIPPEPTVEPTVEPTNEPTTDPTVQPTNEPTVQPTVEPTDAPTAPTVAPTEPTVAPTAPTVAPTTAPATPSAAPTAEPTASSKPTRIIKKKLTATGAESAWLLAGAIALLGTGMLMRRRYS
ncbi:YPDG domain-containing protein [Actinotignum sp. GS-2025c]|uniref:YPDG domain-containing protein n=1 Tax=Actinotignum sp. GS-2025c TaxID=3427276 RepID=UPI003F46A42E